MCYVSCLAVIGASFPSRLSWRVFLTSFLTFFPHDDSKRSRGRMRHTSFVSSVILPVDHVWWVDSFLFVDRWCFFDWCVPSFLFVLNSELMLMDHQVLLLSLFACILSICNPILSLSLDVPAWPPLMILIFALFTLASICFSFSENYPQMDAHFIWARWKWLIDLCFDSRFELLLGVAVDCAE